jgi:hypothetical protein
VPRTFRSETYTFYLSSSDEDPNVSPKITLNFHDYPGGWLGRPSSHAKEHAHVVDLLRKARIVIVAIDAPYLMEQNGKFHAQRNRTAEVLNVLMEAKAFTKHSGVVILAPNRAEKYLRSGSRAEISAKVRHHYADLLAYFAQPPFRQRVKIAIVPVQTIGCIAFDSFSSSRYYKDQTPLPVFWPVGTGGTRRYNPRFLDQPVWHILVEALREAAEADGPNTTQFEELVSKIDEKILTSNGFEIVQSGARGTSAHA